MTARGQLRSRYAALAVFVIAASTTCAGNEPAPREAFITNQPGQSLSIVDLATFKVVDEIKIGGKPAGIAFSSDGKRAFVTAPEGNERHVARIGLGGDSVIRHGAASSLP